MAPFDPLQLLKLLSPLLSVEGGIKSPEEVPRLSSLMKKFSKKLVSRCVYCNVLKATKVEVLNAFLDLEGWTTINTWLVDARDNNNNAFLEELLLLCKELPMTVLRLKQNNTAKLVKTLTKSENTNIKKLSIRLVERWMKLIKGTTPLAIPEKQSTDKVKKKKLKKESEESNKSHGSEDKASAATKGSPPKVTAYEDQEDVEYEPDPPEEKVKNKEPRPKTVKTLQTRFRSTGLIEETPLPKVVAKKPQLPVIDRDLVAAAAKKRMSTATLPAFPEKKVKPSSLITPASDINGPGIKLIPPKPRPVHILHESAGFMDALDAAPVQPLRKKKTRKTPSSPTTPPATTAPPKLQFYKDTLELGDNKAKTEEAAPASDTISAEVKEEPEKQEAPAPEPKPEAPAEEPAPAGPVLRRSLRGKKKLEDEQKRLEEEQKKKKLEEEEDSEATEEEDYKEEAEADADDSEATQEGDEIPMDLDDKASTATTGDSQEAEEAESENEPKKVKSILMLTRKRDKKKSVRWVEDDNLKQFHFFEMDENERVNVSNARNFGDMKCLEMKRERMAFETARRRSSDNMSEGMAWRSLQLIDLPPPLVDPGINSKEKDLQMLRQKTTLEEIFFTREMLPETPHEPDPDLSGPTPQEPVLIPVEDMTNPGVIMDYSTMELPPPKTTLPPVLTNLMMSIAAPFGNHEEDVPHMGGMNEVPMRGPPGHMNYPGDMPMPGMHQDQFSPMIMQSQQQQPPPPSQQQQPLLQGPQMMGPNNMQMWGNGGNGGGGPQEWNGPIGEPMGMFGGNGPPEEMMGGRGPPDMPFGGPPQQEMFQQGMRPMRGGGGPYMGGGGGGGGGRHQRGHRGQRGNMWRAPRVMCKHFVSGTCRFGSNCNFLHPGVNGPAM